MNYGVAFHLEQDGFDKAAIRQAIQLRNLVNEYFRGHVLRESVAAELSRFEHEAWYEKAYLYPSRELPADASQSKWNYEMDYEPLSIWKRVKQPALFLFAEVDEWVPVEQSLRNYEMATAHLRDVTLKQVSDTDHLMRDPVGETSNEYLDILVHWLRSKLTILDSNGPARSSKRNS